MALDQAANFVRGSLSAAVGSGETTFAVQDAAQFPDPSSGEYNCVVWDAANHPRPDQDGSVEIVRVTARDTGADELTVTRGQESTSAAGHPDGAAIQLAPTAKLRDDIQTKTSGLSDDGTSLSIESLNIISRQEVSDASEVVVDGLDDTYDTYTLQILGMDPGEGNYNPAIQVSTDGGSTWESGTDAYRWQAFSIGVGGTAQAGDTESQGRIVNAGNDVGDGTDDDFDCTIEIYRPLASSYKTKLVFENAYIDKDGNYNTDRGSVLFDTAVVTDAIRIFETRKDLSFDATVVLSGGVV